MYRSVLRRFSLVMKKCLMESITNSDRKMIRMYRSIPRMSCEVVIRMLIV